MLYSNYTENLVGLQDVIIKNIQQVDNSKIINIELPVKLHTCPCCNTKTKYIHDYRNRKIKDISAFGSNVILMYRRRRYVCKQCNKVFSETNHFVPKYHRMTSRLVAHVIRLLESEYSFTSVAKQVNMSISTIIRIFDIVHYPAIDSLPQVIAIDEFKGNTNREKYQCILTDPATGCVLDILPTRYQSDLINYFKKYSKEERDSVEYFISDMWNPYSTLASVMFKNSTQIIDKYHYIRQIIWAFERVRKSEQKKYGKQNQSLFKHSKRLLTKRKAKLTDSEKERVNSLLYVSDNIRRAYHLKELFYEVVDAKNRRTAKQLMSDWIMSAQSYGLKDYETCSNTLLNWQKGILNSFDYSYTNGFTEGCNNKIKVLKRNAYGYRNFRRFRNRILHMFNYKSNSNARKQMTA